MPMGDFDQMDEEQSPQPPASTQLDDVSALEQFLDHDDASVIGAFTSLDGEGFDEFEQIAGALQYDWRFAHTAAPAVLERIKAKSGGLLLYRSPRYVSEKYGDRPRERFPSTNLKEAAVKSWLLSKAQPLVGQYTYNTKERYFSKKLPIVLIFVHIDWKGNPKGTAYYANRARKVASQYVGKLQFALAHLGDYEYQMADYGLEVSDKVHDVRIGLIHKEGDFEYTYGSSETKFSAEALTSFADAFLAGKLEPAKKTDVSAPPPGNDDEADVDESAVVTLTASNFDSVVMDSSKDVLVEFYAPWCGHCKALKPEYAKAAKLLEGESSLVLAKMDATQHDPPAGFDVQGYPTLLFVAAEAGATPVPYDGEREASLIAQWVRANAKSLA
eukprot:scaffold175697_cov36-Tisochrysis_lutea.AAC.1